MDEKGKTEINYLFFSFLLLFLLAITFSHFLRMNQPLSIASIYFLLYALGQALLEVFCVMLLGYALHRWMPRWTFKLYIGLSFGFLLAHFANYTLVRLMDVTLSYFFKFFFGCGLDHFRVAFMATNLNAMMIGIIIGAIILVPIAGVAFYWATHKVSLKKPLVLSQRQIFAAVATLSLLLLTLDIIAKPYLTNGLYDKFSKTLPLGSTFLAPAPRCLPLPATVRSSRQEFQVQQRLAEQSFAIEKHPNVYLFVIETLRRDFVNPETAPHLSRFAEENLAPDSTFSNANSTHLSWFSIFHSAFPFNWTEVRDQWTQGSAALQIFKKMGYRIRVYASADLAYFNMDQVIFGKNRQLADSIKDYSSQRQLEPCDRDALAMKAAMKDAAQEKEGTLFIVFLDSTHSEYSTPIDFPRPFQPAAISIDYLAISRSSKDLELLKNRYRNCIHWVDHLMGNFFENLKEKGLYDEAVITVTGDHGEEFFEEGALFHGTHLNDWQTKIPLFYKFPGLAFAPAPSLSTHLDIFPSILHFLTDRENWDDYFDGQSLWAESRWPYILSVQHNGPDVPYEFTLSDGHNKIRARFLNPPLIHTIPSVELMAAERENGNEMAIETICDRFSGAFTRLIADVTLPPAKADLSQTGGSK
jgi:glucan phosphoethanolaminetransferase (alkaline phosphatase superfamily)